MMVEPTALYATNGGNPSFNPNFRPNQGQGFHGGKKGNYKKEMPVCTYCGLTGHTANKCYKLHGYPPSYKPKGNGPWQIKCQVFSNQETQTVQLVKVKISSTMEAMAMVFHNLVLIILVCNLMKWFFRISLHNFKHLHHNLNVLFHNLNVNNCYHICL